LGGDLSARISAFSASAISRRVASARGGRSISFRRHSSCYLPAVAFAAFDRPFPLGRLGQVRDNRRRAKLNARFVDYESDHGR
jgi:hypothetical protein